MITVTIKPFGMFRQFGNTIVCDVRQGCSVMELKNALKKILGETHCALVDDSALADDANILSESYIFQQSATLSILPPVCGG